MIRDPARTSAQIRVPAFLLLILSAFITGGCSVTSDSKESIKNDCYTGGGGREELIKEEGGYFQE
jgi:hypothetical protein